MQYIFKTENEDAVQWMKTLLQNTLESKGHTAAITAYPYLKEWLDMFEAVEVSRTPKSEPIEVNLFEESKPKPPPKPKAKAKKRAAKKRAVKKDTSGLVCNAHPAYGAKRPPRTDCDGCWKLYEKFHPLEYDLKRKNFLRKQKEKS